MPLILILLIVLLLFGGGGYYGGNAYWPGYGAHVSLGGVLLVLLILWLLGAFGERP